MKRLLVCICTGLGLINTPQLTAQHSIPSHYASTIHKQSVRSLAENYIGLQLINKPMLALTTEQEQYLQTLSIYLDAPNTFIRRQDEYLSPLRPTIERQRAELLLALAYYDKEEYPKALALLNSLDLEALYEYEQEQALLLRAYLLLQKKRGATELAEIRNMLSLVATKSNLMGDQAALYICNLLWLEGKPSEAHQRLEQRKWNESILHEVAYQDALLSYSLDKPSVAIANSQQLFINYPQMKQRSRLLGAMAHAYYELGDYRNAHLTLSSTEKQDELLPQEHYILGASLYANKQYDEAILSLQKASLGENELKALAQYALGNIYQHKEEIAKAQLAFDSTIKSTQNNRLKEEAMYRFIELNHKGGQDIFGTHTQIVEEFLRSYPSSPYRTRVLELLKTYIIGNSNPDASLRLLASLERQNIQLQDLKQEVLLRQAIKLKAQHTDYLPTLASAIQLGDMNNSIYARLLALRAEALLHHKRYTQAEQDTHTALEQRKGLSQTEVAEIEYLRAYALYNQQKYSEASTAFKRSSTNLYSPEKQGDALLRLGDCYLITNNYTEALTSYQKAHQTIPMGSEEALYRISTVYGKQRLYNKQIQAIEDVLKAYPQTNYASSLLYEKGRAERLTNKTEQAQKTFETLIDKYPLSNVAPTAKLEQALIYSNQGQDEDAIRAYKELIARYPNTREAENALADLKALYLEQGKSNEYLAYAQTLEGKLRPNAQDEAHLRYLTVEDNARRGLQGSTEALEEYIKKYPQSSDLVAAQKILASRYLVEGRNLDAIKLLQTAYTTSTNGEHKLQLGLQLAQLQQSNSFTSEAYSTYLSVYKQAIGTKRYSIQAARGLLQTCSEKEPNETLSISEEILKKNELTLLEQQEITLLKGRIEEANKYFKQAISTYSTLANNYDSKYGAEATVRHADILMRLKRYKECQAILDKFIASGSSQTYWLARAFVLLSDNYDKQGDRYLAKQYIESLRDNYNGSEEDIQEMISIRQRKYSN